MSVVERKSGGPSQLKVEIGARSSTHKRLEADLILNMVGVVGDSFSEMVFGE